MLPERRERYILAAANTRTIDAVAAASELANFASGDGLQQLRAM
jgi:hypothetical protein